MAIWFIYTNLCNYIFLHSLINCFFLYFSYEKFNNGHNLNYLTNGVNYLLDYLSV